MRILVDLQSAQNGSRFRGIGRYSKALTRALVENRGAHDVRVLLNGLFTQTLDEVLEEFSDILPRDHALVFSAPGPVDELDQANGWRVRAAELLREKFIADIAPDVVLVTTLFEGGEDQSVVSIGRFSRAIPTAVVLYDLIPLLNAEQFLGWAPIYNWYHRKVQSLKHADLLLGISHSASREAVEHLPFDQDAVATISTAVHKDFIKATPSPEQARALHARYGVDRPFVMHSSFYEPRKNFERLIRAFAQLPLGVRRRFQLVLVCKTKPVERAALVATAEEVGLRDGELILTGFVPDEDLVGLYSTCHLFVFPSLHEGFGLPALEAMSCGAPAIGSSTSSIPEVIGRPDAVFDPTSTRSMAALMLRALTDADFLQDLKAHACRQAAQFSWDRTAALCLQALARLLEGRSPAPTGPSPQAGYRRLIHALASIEASACPTDNDLMLTASAVALNEQQARAAKSRDFPGRSLTWRVEGPFDSTYSLALLNRETARALAALGHHVVLHSTEGPGDFAPNPYFLAQHPDLAAMHARVEANPQPVVDVVSRNLYPPRVHDLQGAVNMLHHYAWEESGFPKAWVEAFNAHLSGLSCLSSHIEKILVDNGVSIPMVTSGCGVDHWERIAPAADLTLTAKRFRFLHVSSCFPRKGIDLLLRAYGRAFSATDDVTLIIKTFPNPHNDIDRLLATARAESDEFPNVVVIQDDLTDSELKALYQQCHVLVAPSRAEGFGLPMAEAMLSGLPVITTGWGGQLDFCNVDNSWLVDYEFARADTHFNLLSSVWAEPQVGQLAAAMTAARAAPDELRRAKAQAGRDLLLERFRWSSVTARVVALARHLCFETSSEPELRIGWLTSWRTPCGIATYSEHLISSMPIDRVSVLASHVTDDASAGAADYVRCWTQGKDANGLARVAQIAERDGLNTLVIQFNYGFFNFKELSDFIHRSRDQGIVVVIMMHSTSDPYGQLDNWQLSELQSALARCNRILAHSVGDLNHLKALGLIDNVALVPHGALSYDFPIKSPAPDGIPVIASYGFCLPHKGLPELVHAVRILKEQEYPVRLKLVNARYPNLDSEQLVAQLRQQIQELKLDEWVEMQSEFLADEESLSLLSQADLVVFAYQQTGESASGAVRYGLASGRPVAVTPVSIFDDLEGAAFRLDGTTPELIARGIRSALNAILASSAEAQAVRAAANQWREHHAYPAIGARLVNVLRALHRQERQEFRQLSS